MSICFCMCAAESLYQLLCFLQSLLAVKQKKDKAVSDVLRKFKMSDLDEPLAQAPGADKGRVTPRKK